MIYLQAVSHPDALWASRGVIRMTYDIVLSVKFDILFSSPQKSVQVLTCLSQASSLGNSGCRDRYL